MGWFRFKYTVSESGLTWRHGTVQWLRESFALAYADAIDPSVPPGPQLYKVTARWANGAIGLSAGQVVELDAATAQAIGSDIDLYALGGPELAEIRAALDAASVATGTTVALVPGPDPAAAGRGMPIAAPDWRAGTYRR